MSLRRYTVEDIFKDYSARKAGVVRALTHDVDKFYGLCDPDKDNLCLYGHSNKTWEVTPPPEDVPPKMPEPVLGINFARDGMQRRDWLSLVAVFTDSWLISLAFYLGACLNCNERKRLFKLINDHPTVFEVVSEKNPLKDKPTVDNSSKPRAAPREQATGKGKATQNFLMKVTRWKKTIIAKPFAVAVVEIMNQMNFGLPAILEKWFHGKCVIITPTMAANIDQYECPSCSMRRGRP